MEEFSFNTIVSLLPHEPPMVLVDGVENYDLQKRIITTSFCVSSESIFYDKSIDAVPAWVGIEYMAQSLGVLDGLCGREAGLPPQMGFLLGSRSYNMHITSFKPDEKYLVQVTENFSDNEIGNYSCKIICNEELCVDAEVTVYKPSDPTKFIELMQV
jgi:predicted hotdog family 3-hydroxylacyl-ACP dehydratase